MDKRSILRLLGLSVVGIMPPLAAEASNPDWKEAADEYASLWRIHENGVVHTKTGVTRHHAITIQKTTGPRYHVYHDDFTWYPPINDGFATSENHMKESMEFATLEESLNYALIRRRMFYGY